MFHASGDDVLVEAEYRHDDQNRRTIWVPHRFEGRGSWRRVNRCEGGDPVSREARVPVVDFVDRDARICLGTTR